MRALLSSSAGRTRAWVALGYVLLGLLFIIGSARAYSQLAGPIPDAAQRAWTAELGAARGQEIARQLNAIEAILTRGLVRRLTAEDIQSLGNRVDRLDETWRASGAEVSNGDEEAFVAIGRNLTALRTAIGQAIEAARAGEKARYEELLTDSVQPPLVAIRDALDRIIELRHEHATSSLEDFRAQLRVLRHSIGIEATVIVLVLASVAFVSLSALARQQHQLESQVRRLEEVNVELEAFAGRVAHDLRGPLMPVLLGVDRLERISADPRVLKIAASIRRAIEGAANLIDSLLAFSRAGRANRAARCRADEAVTHALDPIRLEAEARGVTLEGRVDPCVLAIEEPLLRDVLQNLVTNAMRYAGRHGPPAIRVESDRRGDNLRITVSDNGPGIPPGSWGQAFDVFWQANGTPGGIGLGLAIVRRIVEAHGGRVGIGERPGGGAAIWFELPVAAPNGQLATPEPEHRPPQLH